VVKQPTSIEGWLIEIKGDGIKIVNDFGEIKKINYFHVIHGDSFKIEFESGKAHEAKLVPPHELVSYLKLNPNSMVSVDNQNYDPIFGTARVASINARYDYIEIVDSSGHVHQLVPENITTKTTVFSRPEVVAALKKTLTIEPVNSSSLWEHSFSKELERSILKSGRLFDNVDIYNLLSKKPEYTKTLLRRWYIDPIIDQMIAQIETQFGEKFVSILVDPGIVYNFDSFMNYASKIISKDSAISVFELRQRYSNFLGHRRIFRSMMLTPAEAERLKTNGIWTPAAFEPRNFHNTLHNYFLSAPTKDLLPVDPQENFNLRSTGFGSKSSLWISASEHPNVAISVGYHATSSNRSPDQKIYLFELEVPELSIIRYGSKAVGEKGLNLNKHRRLVIGNKTFDDTNSAGVEVFLPVYISPKVIRNVTQINEIPPEYRWDEDAKDNSQ